MELEDGGRVWWIIFGLVSLIAGVVVVATPTSSARVLAPARDQQVAYHRGQRAAAGGCGATGV